MKKTLSLSVLWFFVALFGAASVAAADAPPSGSSSASPFTMNGWQLHEYDIPKLEEAIRRAPDYGVNFFIFSHEFFRSVEGFLASTDDVDPRHPPEYLKDLYTPEYFRIIPGWQSDVRRMGDLALSKGIPFYLWVHEFDDVPKRFIKDGRLQMDDPGLFPYIEQRYEKLIQAVPKAAGFVLTLHESDFRVFRDDRVESKDPVPERIRRICQLAYDVLKRHNKQLIVRDFFYEPIEMEYFQKALAQLPDDIIAMSKDTTHEFHPFYPWDPMHGKVGKKRQIIEIDLGVEKAWSSHGAYAQTDYIRRVAQRARETGLAGLVGRARFHWDHSFDDSHEVNLYAFSRYLQNPDLSVDTVLRDWAARRYPAAAVPYIASAMKRTEFINHHGRWHLEYWFTKNIGPEWGDYPYYYSRVVARSRYKWTHDPADQALEEKLYHPDAATFAKLVAEKDEVIAQIKASQADLRQAGRYLTSEQMAPLHEDFAFLMDAALLQREWIRAYFGLRMFMDKPTEESRMVVEDALIKLERYERVPGVTYGMNPTTGRRYNIDAFVLEMRWRLANRVRASVEDERILTQAKKDSDVFLRADPRDPRPNRVLRAKEAPDAPPLP
jgi:hypothetical protein